MGMNLIELASTNSLNSQQEYLRFSRLCARVCYSQKDPTEIACETFTPGLTDDLLKKGHHSVFEHLHFSFYLDGIPKALAMILNNEKQYVTSEKSGRYTRMAGIDTTQSELYEKWLDIFSRRISDQYPESSFPRLYREKNHRTPAQTLAQENARYVLSTFTPTKMVYTVNLRQLNFLLDEFDRFVEHYGDEDSFRGRLADEMSNFTSLFAPYIIPGLTNQTDRHLSFFGDDLLSFTESRQLERHFSSVYSHTHFLSFAALAQAQRHRTISWHLVNDPTHESRAGYYEPGLLRDDEGLLDDWHEDLDRVSATDYPQAQLQVVGERGRIEDFRSQGILRMCSNAQLEIMEATVATARLYARHVRPVEKWIRPNCHNASTCAGTCSLGGKLALDRLV